MDTEHRVRRAFRRDIGRWDSSTGSSRSREVRGTIAGPLTVNGVRYHDLEKGVDARVARVSVDVALSELLSRRAHVLFVDVNGVDVRLSEPTKKEEEPSKFSLKPPLDMLLDRFTLKDARVSRDGKELFVARSAEAIGSWTGKGVQIQQAHRRLAGRQRASRR